jgi:cell division protein FtsA
MLPAGLVLTGGASQLPGIKKLASRVTNLPCRIGKPEKMVGLTDQIATPAFATSVGLLQWAILMSETNQVLTERPGKAKKQTGKKADKILDWLKVLLP